MPRTSFQQLFLDGQDQIGLNHCMRRTGSDTASGAGTGRSAGGARPAAADGASGGDIPPCVAVAAADSVAVDHGAASAARRRLGQQPPQRLSARLAAQGRRSDQITCALSRHWFLRCRVQQAPVPGSGVYTRSSTDSDTNE